MSHDGGLPVIDPESPPGSDGQPTDRANAVVHGVLLAAGASERYGGRNKLLERLDDVPLVVHTARTLLAADLEGVTVVIGHEAGRVRDAVTDLRVDVRENEAYAEGRSTSVATGVEAAGGRDADAVLVALGDMPDVAIETVDLLVRTYRAGVADALAAAYEGQRGNPVLFDARYFEALRDVEGDVGGREILLSAGNAVAVETDDPGVLYDIDRPEDV